ncbi:toxin-antitoxin system HicB family antitoxin [Bacillus velezensis]|nr:toxin-antitoxin system HicB family antitoxin [Bacillus velezensis]WFF76362.1 toxin-antitoxin system HicB family antitoxin [Bacillus velezensis]
MRKGMSIPEPQNENETDFSGKFTLRVSKSTHKSLVRRTQEENVSLNSLVNQYISVGLARDSFKNAIRDSIEELKKEQINVSVHFADKAIKSSSTLQWPGLSSGFYQLKHSGTKNRARNNTNRLTSLFTLDTEDDYHYEQ